MRTYVLYLPNKDSPDRDQARGPIQLRPYRVGASSTGKHRSPQTAPRLQGPNIGSNEPSRFPEIVGDAFRASLTWSVELSGSLRSVTLSLFRAGAGASGVVLA